MGLGTSDIKDKMQCRKKMVTKQLQELNTTKFSSSRIVKEPGEADRQGKYPDHRSNGNPRLPATEHRRRPYSNTGVAGEAALVTHPANARVRWHARAAASSAAFFCHVDSARLDARQFNANWSYQAGEMNRIADLRIDRCVPHQVLNKRGPGEV